MTLEAFKKIQARRQKIDTPTSSAPSGGTPLFSPSLLPDLHAALEPGETLVWHGQPAPRALFRRAIPAFFFAALWEAVILFLAWEAWREGERLPVWFLLPFALAGLYLFTLPFRAASRAQNTLYAVSDRHAYLLRRKGKRHTLRRFSPPEIHDIRTSQRRNAGSVTFAPQPADPHAYPVHLARQRQHRPPPRIGFHGLLEVDAAHRALEALLASDAPTPL